MIRIVLATGALIALVVAPAVAADMNMPVKAPIMPPPPVASWTGFYIGADIGAAWANPQTYTFSDPGNAAFNSCGPCIVPYQSETLTSGRGSGFLGGLHAGYNWQLAPTWLVGAEGDFMWTNKMDQAVTAPLLSNTPTTVSPVGPVPGSVLSFDNQTKWLASIRGRAGFIVADSWLLYGTGGVAWMDNQRSAVASCLPPATPAGCVFTSGGISSFSQDQTKTGFVVGAGAEWQIPTTHWRARVEYLYYGFNSGTTGSGLWSAVPGGGPLPCIITPTCSSPYGFSNENVQTVRVGLSYALN